jgi:hypothetical protein
MSGGNKMNKIFAIFLFFIIVLNGLGALATPQTETITNSRASSLESFDMVIIAPRRFTSSIQPLIEHKNSHGVQTFLKTTEEIYFNYRARDKSEEIKYFIKDAIEQQGISYVLLIGGRTGQLFRWYVPIRYSNVDDGFIHKQFLSDLYFADIYKENNEFEDWDSNNNRIFSEWYEDDSSPTDKIDLKPDVAVGRLPCRYKFQVDIIVKKIIDYENNAHGTSWSKRALLIGGDTNPGVGDPFPYEGEADCDYTEQCLKDYEVIKLYVSDGSLKGYNDFITSFNAGNGFVLFHGHGKQDGLFTHTTEGELIMVFDSKYISNLNNDNMYPIVVVGCCAITEYDVGILNFLRIFQNLRQYHHFFSFREECKPEVLSWDLIKRPDRGAIAHIGSSSTAWGEDGDANNDSIPDGVQGGYTSGLCAEFFDIIGEGEIDILGDAYTNAIIRVIEEHDATNDRIQCKCIQEFQLIGDPSLKIGGYPQLSKM